MMLLISPSNPRYTLVLLDLCTGEARYVAALPGQADDAGGDAGADGAPHRPFGIGWHQGQLFVANRRKLLGFDRQLRYTGIHTRGLCGNPHQLLATDGAIYVTSPRHGGLLRLAVDAGADRCLIDPATGARQPVASAPGSALDNHHYNSVVLHERCLYVLAHNRGEKPSEAWVLDAGTLRPKAHVGALGLCAHNLCPEPEGITTLDTGGTRCLVRSDGLRIGLGAGPEQFLRGLAASDEYYFIGMFERRLRRYRGVGGSRIVVVHRGSRRVVDVIPVPGVGAVNDMRLLDVFDHAHGVAPFWPARSWGQAQPMDEATVAGD